MFGQGGFHMRPRTCCRSRRWRMQWSTRSQIPAAHDPGLWLRRELRPAHARAATRRHPPHVPPQLLRKGQLTMSEVHGMVEVGSRFDLRTGRSPDAPETEVLRGQGGDFRLDTLSSTKRDPPLRRPRRAGHVSSCPVVCCAVSIATTRMHMAPEGRLQDRTSGC